MIEKLKNLQRVADRGIIAVIRAENADKAIKIVDAVKKGGIDIIEITFTVPGAADVIKELARVYQNGEILLGAGTVLDSETARAALLAGAEFIVSPSFNPEVVRLCNRYQKICIPGAMTIKDCIDVMESGADIIKLFPGSAFEPEIIKAYKGPLPQADFIPTGGVSLNNVDRWIKAGCLAVGIGGELTSGAKTGNYEMVTDMAKKFVAAIKNARL